MKQRIQQGSVTRTTRITRITCHWHRTPHKTGEPVVPCREQSSGRGENTTHGVPRQCEAPRPTSLALLIILSSTSVIPITMTILHPKTLVRILRMISNRTYELEGEKTEGYSVFTLQSSPSPLKTPHFTRAHTPTCHHTRTVYAVACRGAGHAGSCRTCVRARGSTSHFRAYIYSGV